LTKVINGCILSLNKKEEVIMEIPRGEAEELKRYCINASPLLWGIVEGRNKKQRLEKLRDLGFLKKYSKGSNPTYNQINQELLLELGIDGILNKIIIPKVQNRIKSEILVYFRRCWEQGKTPDVKYLKENRIYKSPRGIYFGGEDDPTEPAHIFLQINGPKNFVERWTVFAGLWFERIEPLIEKEDVLNRLAEKKKES
jgi:hypothetical protein